MTHNACIKYMIIGARDSYENKITPLNCDNVNHLVFVGMGGSGTVSDILFYFISSIDSCNCDKGLCFA